MIHAHGLRAGLLAGAAAPRRTPFVVTWHNAVLATGARRALLDRLERWVARRTDVALGASSDLVARARLLGAPDARLGAVAAPALPRPTRSRDEVRAALDAGDRPIVLTVGRLTEQKAYGILLAAATAWSRRTPPPLVLIVGDGPDRDALQRRIDAQRLPVRLLGRRGDVPELLAGCDVFVITSVWEARALAVQEAMRAGRPVVATAVGGIPELVGDAAVLVRPGDPQAVAREVARILDDPAEAARRAARGLEVAATWPAEADTVGQVLALYQELTRTP